MAYITFTDTFGAARLDNGKPGAASRFANWVPMPNPVGDAVELEGTGATVMFQLRDDFGATFEVRKIPSETVSGVSMADVAGRLRRHLMLGGTCAVYTEDASSSTYATCGLAPGTTPQLTMTDARTIEYTLALALINLAVSPVQMVCHYRGGT